MRQCAHNAEEAKTVCKQSDGKVADTCELCSDGDGCNGATKYSPTIILMAIPAVILVKFAQF